MRNAKLSLAVLFLVSLATHAQEKILTKDLQPLVDAHSLAGAVVLAADKEKMLAVEAVGYSDIENNTLMGPDAIVWIASMSKPITAAGLMLLVDEGLIGIDDPVEKYLPEFKDIKLNGEKPKTTITVKHLLTHTSGMPFKSALEAPTLDIHSLKDRVISYTKTPLDTEPGTKYKYSNAGINTAGRLIEVLSGMDYEQFMTKRLFQLLEMKDTTSYPNEAQVKRLAKGYKPGAGKKGLEFTQIVQLKYPLTDSGRQPMPAGGFFSTAEDIAHFCQMVLNDGIYKGKKILSEKAVKEMTGRQTPANMKESWGLGWSTTGDTFGHGGAMATNMSIDRKRNLITVYLVQHQNFPGEGGKGLSIFRKAAEDRFASSK